MLFSRLLGLLLALAASATGNSEGSQSRPPGSPAESSPGPGLGSTRSVRQADPRILEDVLDALRVMQDHYFEAWQGTWPTAIDWTAAVVGTHVAGALASLSQSLPMIRTSESGDDKTRENVVTLYFSQLLGSYFGQNHVSLRNQAFDDMLWVVLGWLEAVNFIKVHSGLYYSSGSKFEPLPGQTQLMDSSLRKAYFGNIWTPAFAHRARVFWELASQGWDTKYCGGGMNWNPRLQVYKNAITNELFVAASVSMYLYFPGDENSSPFDVDDRRVGSSGRAQQGVGDGHGRHDVKYLEAAITGHAWLRDSGMRNNENQLPRGLYVDGFHISGSNKPNNTNTECDVRNKMVYTYNQGVILSGLRGLWKATGDEAYLREGHELIRYVILATGYNLRNDRPSDDIDRLRPKQLPPWYGLGRAGVLEDNCDVTGVCSQDSQTFKGNFFHHFTSFCAPLDADSSASSASRQQHSEACVTYTRWVAHNVRAALATRDSDGKFGMWWTVGILRDFRVEDMRWPEPNPREEDATVDYRSFGVPEDDIWRYPGTANGHQSKLELENTGQKQVAGAADQDRDQETRGKSKLVASFDSNSRGSNSRNSDPNSRGRGRTVETQSSGLALLRALWEISNL